MASAMSGGRCGSVERDHRRAHGRLRRALLVLVTLSLLGGEVVAVDGGTTPTRATPVFAQDSEYHPDGDYDGDRRSDVAVYRPSTGTWFWLKSSTSNRQYGYQGWGANAQGDIPVIGDFDGDGVVDPTVFRPATGTWFVLESHAGYSTWQWFGWGNATDTPVPGDYDGDGKTDGAVYRGSTGTWYVRPSSGAAQWNVVFGQVGDEPVAGDFDGDGKRDPAVYRASTGTWFWLKSSSGYTAYEARGWGVQAQGDIPAPGDYDGDEKTDPCVFRPATGTWFILESHASYTTWNFFGWGRVGDTVVPADYDGDGRTDGAVYRPATGEWWVKPSNGTTQWSIVFGTTGDQPMRLIWSLPVNHSPVADAGLDQTASAGSVVHLNGSASSDVDGDPLTYAWSILSRPAGSAAALSDGTAVTPTFVADTDGSYTIELRVYDGRASSVPDTVTVSTRNSPPVAKAGPDQSVHHLAQTVQLDGSGSSDVDGNALTYAWTFVTSPGGSTVVLSDPTAVKPTFVVDTAGTFVLQLVVNDGLVDSAPDTVTIATGNTPPAADAGSNQTVAPPATVSLNGSSSTDAENDLLTFTWSLLSKPSGSAAALATPTEVTTTFNADLPGQYVIQLIVNDGVADSAPDTVTVSTSNSPPVANAGPDQEGAAAGATVQLAGSASTDPDGNPLTYSWSLLCRPAESAAVISVSTSAAPTFVADEPGTYVAQLVVNDGVFDSPPDTIAVSVVAGGMTLTDPWYGAYRVGASLQTQVRLTLGTGAHGGVTARVTSSDPEAGRVAATASAAGTAWVDLVIPDGSTYTDFYVQGVRGAIGSVTLTATQALFTPATTSMQVVQPVFRLYSLSTSTTTLAADDEFYVYAGVLNTAGTGVWFWQPVSGAGPLPVTFTSSVPEVGQLKTASATGAEVVVEIPVNQEYTPTSVAAGGVAFDPLAAGTTTVSAAAPGFNNAWTEASATVSVSQPGMTLTDPWYGAYRVGASLQTQMRLTLGSGAHGGVTVRVTSGDPAVARVAVTATAAGTAWADLVIPDGNTYTDFYVQGVRGAIGSVTLTATQALFTPATVSLQVVQPVFRLYSLSTSTTTPAADDEFYVYAGVLNAAGTGVWFWQPVSGAGPLPVTFTSSVPGVAQLKTASVTGAEVVVEIPVNQEYTPTSVAAGGVAFDPLAAGTTTVSAAAPGFNNAWTEASATVSVSQPGMTLTDPWYGAYRIGASLQTQALLTSATVADRVVQSPPERAASTLTEPPCRTTAGPM